jgi:RIO-like serine/threonine protein kinase
MTSGLTSFKTQDICAPEDQLGEDGKDGKTYVVKLKSDARGNYNGDLFSLTQNTDIAVKTFKPKKSTNKIKKEAEFPSAASKVGISPPVYGVNLEERYIVMQKLASLPAKDYAKQELPLDMQYQLCALMVRLDSIGVLHGDMNALNVMLNEDCRPYMIDYGFAKKITNKVKTKHGQHPNIRVTLWGLVRGFKRYKVTASVMNDCVEAYFAGGDISEWINRGEELLSLRPKKKRKRK